MHMSLEPRAGVCICTYIYVKDGPLLFLSSFSCTVTLFFLKAETEMNLIQGWKSSAESQQTDM